MLERGILTALYLNQCSSTTLLTNLSFAHDKQKIIRLDGLIRLRTCIQCTLFTMTDGEHIHFMLLPHVKLHQRFADPAFRRV